MVKREGIGYAIELVIAILIVFTFIVGAMELYGDKSYADYRISTVANDITYVSDELGFTDEIAVRGHTGTYETFVNSITDRRITVSGSIRGMPFQDQISIGFHTDEKIDDNTFEGVDQCEGNLDEIEIYHEDGDILKNQNDTTQERYNATLYLANTDDTENFEYDALFVDDGRDCDLTDGGPYYLDDIFRWGDTESDGPVHFYEFKEGVDGPDEDAVFYNATQVKRFKDSFQKPVNNIDVATEIEVFAQGDSHQSYDLKIFRETFNPDIENYEDSFSNSSALFLANVSNEDDSVLDILGSEDYGSVSANSEVQNVEFPDYWAAQSLRDYYMAMGSDGYVRYPSGGDVEVNENNDATLAQETSSESAVINHWTNSERNDLDIDRMARTGYIEYPYYTEEQIDLLVATSYWLTEKEKEFNKDAHNNNLIPTSSTGYAGENHEVPYQFNLRWSR